jgi:hypothetical protein
VWCHFRRPSRKRSRPVGLYCELPWQHIGFAHYHRRIVRR